MDLSNKEHNFLQVAVNFGYLNQDNFERICSGFKSGEGNLVQFLLRNKHLTSPQIAKILQLAKSTSKSLDSTQKKERTNQQTNIFETAIKVGSEWDKFEILKILGQGGMGIVYQARQKGTDRIVALKIMRPDVLSTNTQRRRFLREAQTTAALNHPNIIPVYTIDDINGIAYFTMQYISGETLNAYLKQPDADLNTKLSILIKVLYALQYAHDKRILHRDIKPSNILLDEQREPYLMDFGLAKFLDSKSMLTQTGEIMGTPYYISPEQIKGNKKQVGPQSDIYSAGVLLYNILIGKLPFDADNLPNLYRKIIEVSPLSPKEIRDEIPDDLDAICMKAIAKSIKFRYKTAANMAKDLENFLADKSVRAGRFKIIYQSARSIRRNWKAYSAVLVLLLLCLVPVYKVFFAKEYTPQFRESQHRGDVTVLLELDTKLRHQPDHLPSLLRLAEICERQKQWERLRLCWRRICELDTAGKSLKKIGKQALRTKNIKEAAEILAVAVKIFPDSQAYCSLLAESQFWLGDYENARKQVGKLPKTQAILLAARINCARGNYLDAKDDIAALAMPSMRPEQQVRLLLVKIKIEWFEISALLNQWQWLLQKSRSALTNLGKLKHRLLYAQTILSTAGKSDPFASYLQQQFDLLLCALELESTIVNDPIAQIKKLEDKLESYSVAIEQRLFLQKTMVRCLLRHGNWQEVRTRCNRALLLYPWYYEFYHLRTLAAFYCGDTSKAIEDMKQVLQNDPWNFSPVENLLFLLLHNLTPKNYYQAGNLLHFFNMSSYHSIDRIFERISLDDLKKNYVQGLSYESDQNSTKMRWPYFLRLLQDTKSENIRKMACDILVEQYNNPKLQKILCDLISQTQDPIEKNQLKTLLSMQKNKAKKQREQRIKNIIIRYAFARKDAYSLAIREMGKSAEDTLVEMVKNGSAILRSLAADMLLSIKTTSGCEAIRKIAVHGKYPEKLVAAAALSEENYPVDFTSMILPVIQFQDQRTFLEQNTFYQQLLVRNLDPRRCKKIMHLLMQSQNKMISLYAAYRCNCFKRYLPPEEKTHVEQMFVNLSRNSDPQIQSAAITLFWHIPPIVKQQDNNNAFSRRTQRNPRSQQSGNKGFPGRSQRDSPGRSRRDSPGRSRRDSPGRSRRDSPGRSRRDSPGRSRRDSPGRSRRDSPGRSRRDSPGRSRKDPNSHVGLPSPRHGFVGRWRKYYDSMLLEHIKSPNKHARLAAFSMLALDADFKFYIASPEGVKDPRIKDIRQILLKIAMEPGIGYLEKFWTSYILARLGDSQASRILVVHPQTVFFVRMGNLCGILNRIFDDLIDNAHYHQKTIQNFADIFLKIVEKSAKSEADRKSKQLIIMYLADMKLFDLPVLPMLRRALQSPDLEIRKAAAVGLMICGEKEDIKRLWPLLNCPDQWIRKTAATAIAGLTIKYDPTCIDKLEQMSAKQSELREDVAFGYNYVACNSLYSLGQRISIHAKGDVRHTKFSECCRPDWLNPLQRAYRISPLAHYAFEIAFLQNQAGKSTVALEYIEHALAALKKTSERQDLLKKCLLLKAEILVKQGNIYQAISCLHFLEKECPFSEEADITLIDLYHQLRNYGKVREHTWKTFMKNPGIIINHVKYLAQSGKSEYAIKFLSGIHTFFPLSYQYIAINFPMLRHHPLLKELISVDEN